VFQKQSICCNAQKDLLDLGIVLFANHDHKNASRF
jgi:hypothetical protein